MLTNGEKLVVTKGVAGFLEEGDIVKVVNVSDNGLISFAFGDGFVHMGLMNTKECEEHFKKYKEPKKAPTITQEHIDDILEHSEIDVETVFDKCTIVKCQLPNGFVIVESSACVSPENYDEDMGIDICLERIKNKVWELEGYRLQCELYESMNTEECPYDCNECPCAGCDEDEDEDEDDWMM